MATSLLLASWCGNVNSHKADTASSLRDLFWKSNFVPGRMIDADNTYYKISFHPNATDTNVVLTDKHTDRPSQYFGDMEWNLDSVNYDPGTPGEYEIDKYNRAVHSVLDSYTY